MVVQFNKEFEMLQPDASDFPTQWAQVAASIVAYAELKVDNAAIRELMTELNNGGSGQAAADGYKPPPCLYISTCLTIVYLGVQFRLLRYMILHCYTWQLAMLFSWHSVCHLSHACMEVLTVTWRTIGCLHFHVH